MKTTTIPTPITDTTLEEVLSRFDAWREIRKKGQLIPKDLWQAAIRLADKYPVYKISQILRLDYAKLKRCVQESNVLKNTLPSPTFIELAQPLMNHGECTVEMEFPEGLKLKIQCSGYPLPQLAQLCESFWRKRS